VVSFSAHFSQRQEQRGLRRDVLEFILDFGDIHFARRATWLVVERKVLPPHLRNTSLAMRASQWLVMVNNGVLVTCYRSRRPMRNIRRSH
jgi:hypothetical protein